MAMIIDKQQQTYKHYCRICNKGFGCGRALGGHMRAHGINDDGGGGSKADGDNDPAGCGEWGSDPPSKKRMYALRTNSNRLRSCRACENCGKEFVSWKSFLEHGKCSTDDDEPEDNDSSFLSLSDADDDSDRRGCAGWTKGKRSRRATYNNKMVSCPSTEEEDLANCLMLLSSARVDPVFASVEPEESCASASKEEDRRQIAAAAAANAERSKAAMVHSAANYTLPKGMFECKACKKVFTSHQALGGHRASHKKVKGCFAAKLDDIDDPPVEDDTAIGNEKNHDVLAMEIVPFNNIPLAVTPLKKKSKVHECSLCHRQFASGQALGGHKRCHWITSNSGHDPNPMAKPHHHPQMHQEENNRVGTNHEQRLRPMFDASETLDLNLPARHDIGSPLRLDVPTALYLQQPWVDQKKKGVATSGVKDEKEIDNENGGGCSVNNKTDDYIMEDEIDSKVKLAKLSELKDMNVGGESPWLQVGIGSSENQVNKR